MRGGGVIWANGHDGGGSIDGGEFVKCSKFNQDYKKHCLANLNSSFTNWFLFTSMCIVGRLHVCVDLGKKKNKRWKIKR